MEIIVRQEQEVDYDAVYTINATAFGQENEAKLVDLSLVAGCYEPI